MSFVSFLQCLFLLECEDAIPQMPRITLQSLMSDEYRAQKLFASLAALEQRGQEEISRKQLEVEWLLSAVEVYRRFATELCDSGTPCDVATSAERLHQRATELKKNDVVRQSKLLFGVNCVVFQQSSFGSKAPPNVVGSIEERSSFKGLNIRLLCGPVFYFACETETVLRGRGEGNLHFGFSGSQAFR